MSRADLVSVANSFLQTAMVEFATSLNQLPTQIKITGNDVFSLFKKIKLKGSRRHWRMDTGRNQHHSPGRIQSIAGKAEYLMDTRLGILQPAVPHSGQRHPKHVTALPQIS
jgi:hypothetical protein